MYPETDVPPISVSSELLERLREHLPEPPRVTRARLVREYHLGEDAVAQLWRTGEVERFERLVAAGHAPTLVGRLLLRELPAVEGVDDADVPAAELPFERLHELLRAVEGNEFAKEGMGAVLLALRSGSSSVSDAARKAGLVHAGTEELGALAEEVVRANSALVDSRGDAAFAPLMGDLMRKVRGRADGQQVAQVLRQALERYRSSTRGAARSGD